jgi:hypothetical protein
MQNETVLAGGTNGRKSYVFGQPIRFPKLTTRIVISLNPFCFLLVVEGVRQMTALNEGPHPSHNFRIQFVN